MRYVLILGLDALSLDLIGRLASSVEVQVLILCGCCLISVAYNRARRWARRRAMIRRIRGDYR